MGKFTVINQNHKIIRQATSMLSLAKCYDPVPFKHSRLALSLSVCLMGSVYAHHNAYAEAAGKIMLNNSSITNPSDRSLPSRSVSTDDDFAIDTRITQQDQVEEAMIALKLKQAVERGLIDPSVLEDYKRETLNNPAKAPKANLPDSIRSSQSHNVTKKNSSSSDDISSDETENFNSERENGESDSNATNSKIFDEKFDTAFAQSNGLNETSNENVSLNDDVTAALDYKEQNISTPPELDEALAQVDVTQGVDENLPVATFDSNETQIGLSKDTDHIGFVEPVSRETLGLNDSSPQKTDSESLNNSGKGTSEKANTTTGIDPEQYLPKYNENDSAVDSDTKVASENLDEDDDEGFFKGLYNRIFNGGYAALPKIKAEIYRTNGQQLDRSGNRTLLKVDKDEQPFKNIKAAMENITVESIQDFTAVRPKLREVATDAAQAVGYYDTKIKFEKESTSKNRVNVIIEALGKPVKVNSRIIDIRGDGSDLEAFEKIKEEAKPIEDSTFNHGEYIQTKSEIESVSKSFGFFDAQWLNKSVDIILPDNTADVDLIYKTGERYKFDDVVFYTIDRETGRLTIDPDKLPVNPEILHQLYDFEKGDDFYRPLVTNFTNNLSKTRYFNAVNVDTIRPLSSDDKRSTLGFDDQENDAINEEDRVIYDLMSDVTNDKQGLSDQQTNTIDVLQDDSAEDDSDFQPIDFSVDDETHQRLGAIKAKVDRLSNLPDDRVLDTEQEEAKSLLGKISNAISSGVEKILPDDEEDLEKNKILADASDSKLDARKTPEDVTKDKAIPIYVFVDADKPKDVDLGIGYGTDTGFRAVARLEHNLINRDGYQAGAEVAASEINRSINLHAKRPWKHPLDDTLNGKLSYVQEEINQGEGNLDLLTNTIKAGLARQIRSDSGWNRTYSLNYRLDNLKSGITGPKRSELPVPFNRENSKFEQQALLLGYVMDKTSTDSVSNPTKGWHQFYSIEVGSKDALTDTDMAIARAGVNGIYSFGEENKHQILGSIEGGYIWADNFEDVPYKLRFFAGGDRSIRGYDYNSLSPLEKSYLTGGQVLALGSTEYNYEFKPGVRGAVFADVGNAYDTDFSNDTKLGVGFGVRWASPVGMVRLDLAAGVLEDSIPVRLHFFIGSPLQ